CGKNEGTGKTAAACGQFARLAPVGDPLVPPRRPPGEGQGARRPALVHAPDGPPRLEPERSRADDPERRPRAAGEGGHQLPRPPAGAVRPRPTVTEGPLRLRLPDARRAIPRAGAGNRPAPPPRTLPA